FLGYSSSGVGDGASELRVEFNTPLDACPGDGVEVIAESLAAGGGALGKAAHGANIEWHGSAIFDPSLGGAPERVAFKRD
ncbi:MAG TPA: hypothetical protein VK446_16835, partial [Methylocystis sp.]|nr:hypothetical protein [Methylocystis sp.]